MSSLRRYEILLPLRFNDGQPVPLELVDETVIRLGEQFGIVSAENQPRSLKQPASSLDCK